MKKKIPKFENEGQEREFWSNHDSTEYLDWGKAKRVSFPNLKPSTETTNHDSNSSARTNRSPGKRGLNDGH
jgi:hypothetical protein